MMDFKEILELLRNCPEGYIAPNHDLFKSSNCNLLQTYEKLGAINSKKDETSEDPTKDIFCNVFGCSAVYDNISSYQSHYNAMHRFICAECKKALPTDHLLDLHILEQHDLYFKVRVEKGERLFKCYLEECKEVFANSHQRKVHCIELHKFPSNFRFDQVAYKSCKQKDKASKKNLETVAMEVEKELKTNSTKSEMKLFSFGHQRDKTFCPKCDNGEILEDMTALKLELQSI